MFLNEATLLNNLRIRYMKNQIYVSICRCEMVGHISAEITLDSEHWKSMLGVYKEPVWISMYN